jgi:hypothetical protein
LRGVVEKHSLLTQRSDVLRTRSSQPLHGFLGYSHSYNIHNIFDSLSLYDNFKVLLVFSILNAVGLTSQTGQTGALSDRVA